MLPTRGISCLSICLYGIKAWLPCTERFYYRHPYAIKTQAKGHFVPKPLEVYLYGIFKRAWWHQERLGADLWFWVAQSALRCRHWSARQWMSTSLPRPTSVQKSRWWRLRSSLAWWSSSTLTLSTWQSGALSLVQITRDTVLSLVEPYYAGAKVYTITTHLIGPIFRCCWCLFSFMGACCVSYVCCYGIDLITSIVSFHQSEQSIWSIWTNESAPLWPGPQCRVQGNWCRQRARLTTPTTSTSSGSLSQLYWLYYYLVLTISDKKM